MPLMLLQKNGDAVDIQLEDYKYSPQLGVCLFSLTKAIEKGWAISNDGMKIILRKGPGIIEFDHIMKTRDGILCGIELLPRVGERLFEAVDGEPEDTKKKPAHYMDINRFHRTFGHPSEQAMRSTAKFYDWQLTGKFEACEDCQMSNAQQRAVSKTTEDKKSNPGERIFIDCSRVVDHMSLGGATRWLGIADDATGFLWSSMLDSESQAPEKVMTFIRKMDDRGHPVKYIRCDDASIWYRLRRMCEASKVQAHRDIKFEFTARDTPQANGMIERRFAAVTRRIRAALNAAKLPEELRKILWGEAVMYCTDVHNILLSRSYDKPAYTAFYKENFPQMKFMRQFGEIGYVKWGVGFRAKLKDRGIPMLYLGRAQNHSCDTYRFMNLETKKIIHSRDATWMNKVYGEWKKMSLPTTPDVIGLLPAIYDVETGEQLREAELAKSKVPTEKITAPTQDHDSGGETEATTPTASPTREADEDEEVVRPEPTRRSTRANPVNDDLNVSGNDKALRELARLEGTFNPDAESLADRIRGMRSRSSGSGSTTTCNREC